MGVLRPVVPLVFNVAAAVPNSVSVEPGSVTPVVIVPVPAAGPTGPPGADSTIAGPQGVKGDTGDIGLTGLDGVAFRYIGSTAPDTTGWAVNDFWYDTSTETP